VCAKPWPETLSNAGKREVYLVVDVRPLEGAKAKAKEGGDDWHVISFAVLRQTRAGRGTTYRGPTNTMGHVVRKAGGDEEADPIAVTIAE
jgi:hypothetical protein